MKARRLATGIVRATPTSHEPYASRQVCTQQLPRNVQATM
jgi:hypothetical protein